MSELTKHFHGSASSFGVLYPMHYFLALVPTGPIASTAATSLMEAGFASEDVVSFEPEVFVELVQAHREHKGLWNHFMESLSRIVGTEAAYIDLDLELSRNGAAAVAVRAESEEEKNRARTILLGANPLAMRYYAHLSIDVDIEHPNTHTSAQQSGVG